jgi:hypothetical protein
MFANDVPLDVVDRVQGHAIRGIAQTYVRGSFMEQKRKAIDTLARAVERILQPEPAKVIPLRG